MRNYVEFDQFLYCKDPTEIINKPVVVKVNKFDESAAETFNDQITEAHTTGQPIIPVVIDSYGGEVYSLLAMVASIKSSKIPIATIVEGKAMSCGALLFSFGIERYMDKEATLMIHDVSSGNWGKVEEIKADAKETERLNQKLYKMMAKNCGKAEDYFLTLIHKKGHADWYMSAKEALKYNIATELRIPSLVTKISVSFNFS